MAKHVLHTGMQQSTSEEAQMLILQPDRLITIEKGPSRCRVAAVESANPLWVPIPTAWTCPHRLSKMSRRVLHKFRTAPAASCHLEIQSAEIGFQVIFQPLYHGCRGGSRSAALCAMCFPAPGRRAERYHPAQNTSSACAIRTIWTLTP